MQRFFIQLPGLILLAILMAACAARSGKDLYSLPADAQLPDSSRYAGELKDGRFHGQGRLVWANGARYEGGFRKGLFHGQGDARFADGSHYRGRFRNGLFNGTGSLTQADGTRYHGDFVDDVFQGQGSIHYADGAAYVGEVAAYLPHGQGRLTDPDGNVYEGQFSNGRIRRGTYSGVYGDSYTGEFRDWNFHGPGEFVDAAGNRFQGEFNQGDLSGQGRIVLTDGSTYEGEIESWQYHGEGTLVEPSGDTYTGEFRYGMYHGEGEMVYAEPADGHSRFSGRWEYGRPINPDQIAAERARSRAMETAFYAQDKHFARAREQLKAGSPEVPELYFLGVAGDGTQEVFLKEVNFVQKLFDQHFGTEGRSLTLSNNRKTFDSAPLATKTGLDRSLALMADAMNPDEDILFLYLTSHGSEDHLFSINLPHASLAAISAAELAESLEASEIKWKVVVVSACYSGGFLPLLESDQTLVMTAAREDRQSFGCSDDSDMTYFGRAYFADALPRADSFQDAFGMARDIIRQREKTDNPGAEHSEPQISVGKDIAAYLESWWPARGTAASAGANR